MDGIHDLGGRQGFGPIAVDEPEEPFHSIWEGRMWGIAQGIRKPSGWTIDWWRHGRELIDPADYLTRPYFDQWMQNYTALLIDSGIFTVGELATAPSTPQPGGDPVDVAAVRGGRRFDRASNITPAFAVGDTVQANAVGAAGHTRLPGYVRGLTGVIDHFYGCHVLPDASAHGKEHAEPLYSVKFAATTLWPEATASRDCVCIDMWESYLEPT